MGGLGVVLYTLYGPDAVKTGAKETLLYLDDLGSLSTRDADGIYRLKPSAFAGLYGLYTSRWMALGSLKECLYQTPCDTLFLS